MTEKSMLWAAASSGDGASTYTSGEIVKMLRAIFGDGANDGVLPGVDGGLACSGSASPVAVASGAALVYGLFYWNTASVNVTVTTPSIGTTGHRIVLRADWTARTIRIALKSSADGTAAIPALTQTAGVTYEISLATLTITTGGVITLTDARTYNYLNGQLLAGAYDPETVSDTEAGNGLPFIAKRQGASTTNWRSAGTTSYTPAKVLVQAGASRFTGLSGTASSLITFPTAFKAGTTPIIICLSGTNGALASSANATESGFYLYCKNQIPFGGTFTGDIFWLAIGERT